MLSGCPGTLDLTRFENSGTGGNTGTGGSNPTGGATGTGGTASNCTGNNDGATIIAMNCAVSGCHDTAGAPFSASLDLTVNATIGSRLVGVMAAAPTATNQAVCTSEQEPYLIAQPGPAMGLLIDKVKPTRPCGAQMPADSAFLLTPTQQSCLIQWATTLTSP
jgi:hypothetical protein